MSTDIHIGGDPRNYLEFSEIRNEINKMNHPAAPEMDFNLIETLSLELFRQNGVDLQTATYYTFAKTKLVGLEGFSEGCELIATLVTQHWREFWPDSENARIDMLDWLNNRVGYDVRNFSFTTKQIPLLLQIEQPLKTIVEKLKGETLKKTPKIVELYDYVKNTRATLEKRLVEQQTKKAAPKPKPKPEPVVETPEPEVVAPPPPPPPTVVETIKIEYVPVPTPISPRFKGWHGFILGALVTGASLFAFSHYQPKPIKPEHVDLSLFTTMTDSHSSLLASHYENTFGKEQNLLSDYEKQLEQITQLPPLATRYYGDNLVRLSARLWPDNDKQKALAKQWQSQLTMQHQDRFMRDNYYNAQQLLNDLVAGLNRAEETNRSFTLSQLKSSAFAIQKQLDQEVPLEELLRQLSTEPTPSPVLVKNINERFNNLLSYYHHVMEEKK